MNELIKLNTAVIGNVTVQTVNARDLHSFLSIGKDFSSWIKNQISRARIVDNRDYTCSPSRVSSLSGTKHIIEYYLTIEAAKQIAMMSETDKGFEIRDYFIECERRALAKPAEQAPAELSRMQLIQLAMEAERERLEVEQERLLLETKVSELAPKAEALDRIATGSDGSFCLTDAAKVLQAAPRQFTTKLQELGWIHRRPMGSGWLAYQEHIRRGLLEHKTATGEKSDGSEWTSTQVRVTAKGIAKLSEIFSQGGALI